MRPRRWRAWKKKVSPKNKPVRRQPQRTCIICRQTSDKRSLVRIVRTAPGTIQIDERGKVPGRGAYLCHQTTCWQTALQGHALQHALNTQLNAEAQQQLTAYAQKLMTQHRAQTENSQ